MPIPLDCLFALLKPSHLLLNNKHKGSKLRLPGGIQSTDLVSFNTLIVLLPTVTITQQPTSTVSKSIQVHSITTNSVWRISGWSPSITLAEGEPGDTVIFYFRFGELGLYSQVCHRGVNCLSHKLHNGFNITMNGDQGIPLHFWNAYWALILFVVTVVGLIALFSCVRRSVNHVRRIEYSNIQTDPEQPTQVVLEA